MTWTIDTAHSTIGFSAKHLGVSTVRGQFTTFRGDIDLPDDGDLSKVTGRVVIDTASVDTGNAQRDGHLRNADFFNTEAYPEMVFDLRGVEAVGGDRYRVTGDLTLLGVTRPITLEYEHNGIVEDPFGNTKLGGSITGTVNRSDWGLKWNVPLGGGGLLVSEKVKIEVDGQLTKSREAVAQEVAQETAGSR